MIRGGVDTPLGRLTLTATDEGALTAIDWAGDLPDAPALAPVADQIAAYFDGRLSRFDLALAPEGTPFQHRVWAALRDIPHGETRSYADIACAIGTPGGAQAVGQANNRNPIPIIIPCHRVVAANGGIGGFGGGLDAKRALLSLEGASFEAEQPRLL
ncbi:MAG: methylated-DNA--[protein]-cysteine S-methyltransferase [Jannaschia sp.]